MLKIKQGKNVVLLNLILNKATSDCFINVSPIFLFVTIVTTLVYIIKWSSAMIIQGVPEGNTDDDSAPLVIEVIFAGKTS